MIKATELRLGNIVLFQSFPQEVRLSEIEIQKYVNDRLLHESHGVDPMPLTTEILINSGFLENSEDYEDAGHRVDYLLQHLSLVKLGGNDGFDPQFQDVFGFTRVRYVHQLQNLYFALYGEELNIVL